MSEYFSTNLVEIHSGKNMKILIQRRLFFLPELGMKLSCNGNWK